MAVDVISCCFPFWARHYYPKNICVCPPALWVVNGVCEGNLGSQQEASLAQQGSNRFWNCVWTLRSFWDPVVSIIRSKLFCLLWPHLDICIMGQRALSPSRSIHRYWFIYTLTPVILKIQSLPVRTENTRSPMLVCFILYFSIGLDTGCEQCLILGFITVTKKIEQLSAYLDKCIKHKWSWIMTMRTLNTPGPLYGVSTMADKESR